MTRLAITTTTLSTHDARSLADFYQALLGYERATDEPGWVVLSPPGGGHRLAFHHDHEYRPPTWPSRPDAQLMMAHLEIATDDVAGAVERATGLGATLATAQPQEHVRVMLDPHGHPFCLFPD